MEVELEKQSVSDGLEAQEIFPKKWTMSPWDFFAGVAGCNRPNMSFVKQIKKINLDFSPNFQFKLVRSSQGDLQEDFQELCST